MLCSEDHALALADEFYSAALGTTSWYSALDGLAKATGSRSGELITVGADASVPVNLMTNTDPELHVAFAAARGGDPTVNPRVNAGMRAAILKVQAENDFITPDEHRTHPHYNEFARPWDIPYICLATLDRCEDLLVGLAVLRSEKQGHINAQERAVFASLAPHVRAAVRMQMALESNGLALLTGTMEALGMPVFVCRRNGSVQTLTASAEELARSGRGISLRNQKMRAFHDEDDKALSDAIERAAQGLQRLGAPATQTLVVRDQNESISPLVLDVMLLPSAAREFTSGPRVLVVARGSRGNDSRKAAILQSIYGFTSAETDIALQLAQGKATEAIAQERGVAIGTVRAQIKSLLAKLGVSRQVELVARLSEF
jgi:DNA-binding CsgD family transcriptional regulator